MPAARGHYVDEIICTVNFDGLHVTFVSAKVVWVDGHLA